jgi:hypothetical protein
MMRWFYKLPLPVRSRCREHRVNQELGVNLRFNPMLPAPASFNPGLPKAHHVLR